MENYGSLIESALSVCLDDKTIDDNNNNNEKSDLTADEDDKKVMKAFEESIECKILSLEIVKSISNYFCIDNEETEEDEVWENCDSDSETNETNGKMDIEMSDTTTTTTTTTHNLVESNDDNLDPTQLKTLIKKFNFFHLFITTIKCDNENVYQESTSSAANRIEHLYKSIKFIKMEAVEVFALLFKLTAQEVESVVIVDLLDCLSNSFSQEDSKGDAKFSLNLVELVYDLFQILQQQQHVTPEGSLSLDRKNRILTLCKDVIYKYKGFNIDVTARLVKIMGLIAIRERDLNLNEGSQIIQV
jgi:hypothetical protein